MQFITDAGVALHVNRSIDGDGDWRERIIMKNKVKKQRAVHSGAHAPRRIQCASEAAVLPRERVELQFEGPGPRRLGSGGTRGARRCRRRQAV